MHLEHVNVLCQTSSRPCSPLRRRLTPPLTSRCARASRNNMEDPLTTHPPVAVVLAKHEALRERRLHVLRHELACGSKVRLVEHGGQQRLAAAERTAAGAHVAQ